MGGERVIAPSAAPITLQRSRHRSLEPTTLLSSLPIWWHSMPMPVLCVPSMSFAEEKEHKADERVAAAEARARQAEEQLMSIAATLRLVLGHMLLLGCMAHS